MIFKLPRSVLSGYKQAIRVNVNGKVMNRLTDKLKMILLIVSFGMSFTVYTEFNLAQIQQIAAAAKLHFSSQESDPSAIKTVEGIVEKTLSVAIVDPERVAEITKAFVTSNLNTTVAITYAVAKLFPDRAVKIVAAVVGVAVTSPSHVFVQSESVANNSAAVLAMRQGASSPDLAGSLAGEIIRTVITINPRLPRDHQDS